MKFIVGLIIGNAIGPRVYDEVDKRYGHVLIPYLETLPPRFQAWVDAKVAEK